MVVGFAVIQYGIKELGVGQGSETDFAVWSIPAENGVHIAETEGAARTAATNSRRLKRFITIVVAPISA